MTPATPHCTSSISIRQIKFLDLKSFRLSASSAVVQQRRPAHVRAGGQSAVTPGQRGRHQPDAWSVLQSCRLFSLLPSVGLSNLRPMACIRPANGEGVSGFWIFQNIKMSFNFLISNRAAFAASSVSAT